MRSPFTFSILTSALASLLLLAGCSPKIGAALSAAEMSDALPTGTSYALVHLYRPGKMAGFAIGYDVRANDTVVYRARNGSRTDLRRTQAGPFQLSAKTETREEMVLTVEPGREYYVRCTIGMGALVGRPHLMQVSAAEGRRELAGISPGK